MIYRAIFRIDYPLSYNIMDKLGAQLDFIQQKVVPMKFDATKFDIDPLKHSISFSGQIDKNRYNIRLSLNVLEGTLDFPEGTEIRRISANPLFGLLDQIIENLAIKEGTYNRIGFRIFVLEINEKFNFENILKLFKEKLKLFETPITQNFAPVNDAGIVLETLNDDSDNIRVSVGPYQADEKGKYFIFDPQIEEALIFDIDVYQKKIKIPGFKLSEFIKEKEKAVENIVTVTSNNLKEIL